MFVAILVQSVALLLVALIAWLGWGAVHAMSLAAGGAAVVVPNTLFAAGLKLAGRRHAVATMFGGEFLKVVLSIGGLWAAVKWVKPLSWGGLIAGLVTVALSLLLVPAALKWMDKRRAAVI